LASVPEVPDPFGRRIQKSGPNGTTNYLYDVFDLMENTGATGNVLASYTQSDRIDQPLAMLRGGLTSYFQTDGLGAIKTIRYLGRLLTAE